MKRTRSTTWNDERIEQTLGRLLQLGVLLAASIVALGAAGYLATHAGSSVDYRTFHATTADLRSIRMIVAGAARLRSVSLIQFGLLLLIALPIARVGLSLIAFVMQRDRLYIALTAVVLAILAYGLTGASA